MNIERDEIINIERAEMISAVELSLIFDIGIVFGILGFAIGCSFVVTLISIYQFCQEIKRKNSNCNCLSESKNDQTLSKGENP